MTCLLMLINTLSLTFLRHTGKVIRPGDTRCILNEGMPHYRNPFEKGRLVVQFTVRFPNDDWIKPEQVVHLERYLPSRREVIIPDNAEDCVLHKMSQSSSGFGTRRQHEVYETDFDDEGPSGHRVQCASQ